MTHAYDRDLVARIVARSSEPDTLAGRRLEALARFDALPWPDPTGEEWRHTDIRGLDLGTFDPLPAANAEAGALEDLPADVRRAAIGDRGDRWGLAVQMDADVVHLRLAPPLAEKGVVFLPLARASAEHPDLVAEWLGRAGSSDADEKFTTLNEALATGGTFLYVPPGVAIERPIQSVRWLTSGGIATFPRVIVVADEGSQVTYIDYYGSAPSLGSDALSVADVQIHAERGANVSYLSVQDWSQDVWHFGITRAHIGRDATVRTLAATLGGRFARSVTRSMLNGQGAHAELLGVYFGDHDQHIDNRTLQHHRAPDTSSDLYYKGALKGSSRAIYSGLVDIEKDAPRADAQQANRNLLLSPNASADPSPFLEIKTSDVTRATHGVSVGRPSEDVLFYLRSRGLDDAEAERLYVTGFFQELIDRVRVPEIRASLEAAVEEELALEDA